MSAHQELQRRLERAAATIEPCLPRRAKVPPSGPDWLHEIKHDGFRILARKAGNQVKLITRNVRRESMHTFSHLSLSILRAQRGC